MRDAAVVHKKLGEQILAKGGDLSLSLLLELLVPVRKLRDLAREYGLSPKGGFRLDKAPAHVLAPLLAEQREPERVDALVQLLVPAAAEAPPATDPAAEAAASEAAQLLPLRDAELSRLRDELERAREGAARGLARETEQARRWQQQEQELLALRAERSRSAQAPPRGDVAGRDDKELLRRVHDLELEREGFLDADQALRRQLAHNQTRLRDLEAEVAELEALLPKGRRRRKVAPPPPPPPDERRFRLPRFTAAFYKSLEGKERRGIERAIQAILLFCTEGHGYPGLEVKQLGGQDTWSLRASLGLRVYFRPTDEGDIELLELGDREEQHTTLRRLKER